jgi:hypothetical protein
VWVALRAVTSANTKLAVEKRAGGVFCRADLRVCGTEPPEREFYVRLKPHATP